MRNGTFYTVIVNDTKQSTLQQNTVDGPFANIILQKLKFSLKVADPPSEAVRITPTPSRKPFTGEVRYMVAGKTTWETPQTFSGVIDNQFQTYEVSLAALPDVDITKLQITFPLFLKSTQLYFDWIRLTGQPKPTPTPTPTPILGNAIKFSNEGFNDSYLFVQPNIVFTQNPFTIETWVKIAKPTNGTYIREYPILMYTKPQTFLDSGYIFKLNAEVQEVDYARGKWTPSFKALISNWSDYMNRHLAYIYVDNRSNASGTSLDSDIWYHIAVVSYSETNFCHLDFYIDGILSGSTTRYFSNCTISTQQPQQLRIAKPHESEGGISGFYFTGQLDELRISKGRRYTTNFVPQKTPFTKDNNTLLLYHFDETNGVTQIQDDSINNNNSQIVGTHVEFIPNNN